MVEWGGMPVEVREYAKKSLHLEALERLRQHGQNPLKWARFYATENAGFGETAGQIPQDRGDEVLIEWKIKFIPNGQQDKID